MQAHHHHHQLGVSAGRPYQVVAGRFFYRRCAHWTSIGLHCTAPSGLRLDKFNFQPPSSLPRVSSRIEEDTRQSNAGKTMVKVKFVLQRSCEFGQQFNVIGNHKMLGAWAPEAAILMQWSEGHIWTSELELSVGMCVEFKVILMAGKEVLEWKPGPNCKLEIPEASLSLVVFVPWSDEEVYLQNNAPVDVEVNELQKSQVGDEFASSVGSLPDLVEDIGTRAGRSIDVTEEFASSVGSLPDLVEDIGTRAGRSIDVTEEQPTKERITNTGTIKLDAKDSLDQRQTETKGILTGDQGVTDAETSRSPELKSSKVLPSFAIPESWYGEESKKTSSVLNSHNLSEHSSDSQKDFATGESMISATDLSSDKEEENGGKVLLLNGPEEVIAEVRSTSMVTTVFNAKEENGEKLMGHNEPVEVTPPRNIETRFLDTEPKDINEEESGQKLTSQNGPVEVVAEASLGTTTLTTVSNNGDEEVMAHNEPSEVISEVSQNEIPSSARDSLENVETEPSVVAKDKTWRRKGWSKLWGALVKGRIDDVGAGLEF